MSFKMAKIYKVRKMCNRIIVVNIYEWVKFIGKKNLGKFRKWKVFKYL